MPDIAAAIRALNYDEVELVQNGQWVDGSSRPILQRSIANDLRQMETVLGAKGKTNLFALAAAIDEALLALVEE